MVQEEKGDYMIEHLQNFFNSLLGANMPEFIYQLFGLSLVFIILRAFMKLFNLDVKPLDYCYYIVLAWLALSELGGFSWSYSLS